MVLVDFDLEDFDGLTLCREIRKASDIPMIGFTSSEMNRILALEGGCDDCIDKPYSSREFVARVSALLRRSRVSSSSVLAFGELSIHPTTREVRVGDRSVKATRKEFELLHLLASHPDSLFSRAELLRRVWQFTVVHEEVTPLASRTIDTHVSSLRKKLGAPHWIVTVRGVGFRFNDPAVSGEPHETPVRARAGNRPGTVL
ncbi:DNA-binding response OmpR family regulator [Nocardiopsis algeriensis]|uniref:DNA-binding response OmpR family regulator n=1 Tax=Nocardiopsis algeriensis TaxID=1478215 RepID=A0A841IR48_9ACTN|nr:DNA-binding response OmpR family regulator [Nocardiopsis algeriensis]